MLSFLDTPAQSSYPATHYGRTWRWPKGSLSAKQAVYWCMLSLWFVKKETMSRNLVPRALFPGFGGGEKRPGDEVECRAKVKQR